MIRSPHAPDAVQVAEVPQWLLLITAKHKDPFYDTSGRFLSS